MLLQRKQLESDGQIYIESAFSLLYGRLLVIRKNQTALQYNELITSRCLQTEPEWIVIDALKVYPVLDGRLEKTSEDLTQRSYGSRTFTCNSLQFKTVYSPAKRMMEWNVTSFMWRCCSELPGGVLFGGRFEVVKGRGAGGVDWEAEVRLPDDTRSSFEMPTASRPGGAGCNVAISHCFCVAFHLWPWFQRALLKL